MVSLPRRVLRSVARRANKSNNEAVRSTYRRTRDGVRRVVNTVTPLQLGWVGTLRAIRWVGPTTLEFEGWGLRRGYRPPEGETTRVWLEDRAADVVLEAAVTMLPMADANRAARDVECDHADAGFVARVDIAPLLSLASERALNLRTLIEIPGEGGGRRGWFDRRNNRGSAGHLPARRFGDVLVSFDFGRYAGLVLEARVPDTTIEDVQFTDRRFEATVRAGDLDVTDARLSGPLGSSLLSLEALGQGRYRVAGAVPRRPWTGELDSDQRPVAVGWHSIVLTSGKSSYPVDCGSELPSPSSAPLSAAVGGRGEFLIRDADPLVLVQQFDVEMEPKPRLRFSGLIAGDLPEGTEFLLRGRHQSLPVRIEVDGDAFTAEAELLQSRWGSPEIAPATGRYQLIAETPDGVAVHVESSPQVTAATPRSSRCEWFLATDGVTANSGITVSVTPPLRDDEIGQYHQARLARKFAKRKGPAEDSVYFESFYGRQATCNPLALDREIAHERPDYRRYWGVVDRSVWTPEGATPVVEGSQAWWRARVYSRYVVANDWLRAKFVHQPGQVVLQTWHGSMLKRIGLDRPSVSRSTRTALMTERNKWDLLVSQNRHSTDIFATAYDWHDGIVEEGYPRNDLMTLGDGQVIRERLGIPEGKTAILYAPTWRDNVAGLVTFLDLSALAEELGPDYVILLRGHSRTMKNSQRVLIPGVIDVTTYPNVTELFMASDALITDYSSVMFDFSVTGRPMIFFVPDMDDYRDSVRGVYFDLSEVAPGPVVATQAEVVDALRSMGEDTDRYAERYTAWRERFNALDDGGSAARTVQRLFAAGEAV